MLPTCLRHFSPTFTSALPPLLPPHYRQNNICTDILHRHLHRHLHRQNSINLQRSQTSAKLITFPKLSQKGKNRRKGDYTLLYIEILRENGRDYKSPESPVEHFLTTDCKSVGTPNGVHAISNRKNHRISTT